MSANSLSALAADSKYPMAETVKGIAAYNSGDYAPASRLLQFAAWIPVRARTRSARRSRRGLEPESPVRGKRIGGETAMWMNKGGCYEGSRSMIRPATRE